MIGCGFYRFGIEISKKIRNEKSNLFFDAGIVGM
jgi:hypothetical protein